MRKKSNQLSIVSMTFFVIQNYYRNHKQLISDTVDNFKNIILDLIVLLLIVCTYKADNDQRNATDLNAGS